jgi:phosphoribosylcarboxyaminoimidazole (NCAIR) mutase
MGEVKMLLNIVLGSDSDWAKVPALKEGVERATREISGLGVFVDVVSADNTPSKTEQTFMFLTSSKGDREYGWLEVGKSFTEAFPWLTNMWKREKGLAELGTPNYDRRALITGAGMSNVLTGIAKTYAGPKDLVIGIPLPDSTTDGLSSLFSTSEKPPLNPVLTVGMANTYAALNIAYRFMNQGFGYIVVPPTQDDGLRKEVRGQADKLGIEYRERDCFEIQPNDIVVNFVPPTGSSSVRGIDDMLKEGKGVQIVCSTGKVVNEPAYIHLLDETSVSGLVTARQYGNAFQIAAVVAQDEAALEKIKGLKADKTRRLDEIAGFYVVGGQTRALEMVRGE